MQGTPSGFRIVIPGMRLKVAAIVVLAVVLAGCSLNDEASTQPSEATTTTMGDPDSTSGSSTAPGASEASTTTSLPTRADFSSRRCGTRIGMGYGTDDPADADFPILSIGPISLLDLDFEWTAGRQAADFGRNPDGDYVPMKFVLVVSQDAEGPVVVSIADDDRDHAGLVYDVPGRFPTPDQEPYEHPSSLAETDHTMKFEVCDLDAQYNGGIVVTEPTCLDLFVIDEGLESDNEWTASIPWGVSAEACLEA